MAHRDPPEDVLKTTWLSLSVVEALYRLDGARLSELTEEFGVSKSTLHQHLTTLRRARFVVKEGDVYHLGLRLFEFGEHSVTRKAEYRIAEGIVDGLAEKLDEVPDFSVEEHGLLVSLYSDLYNTHRSNPNNERRTFYMHNTATGKAILSELSERSVDAIVERWGLPRATENTRTTTREELDAELAQIRERGYAVNDEEALEGLFSVAVPVCYPNGEVCGALSLDAPTYRIERAASERLVEHLEAAAAEFESELEALFGG